MIFSKSKNTAFRRIIILRLPFANVSEYDGSVPEKPSNSETLV